MSVNRKHLQFLFLVLFFPSFVIAQSLQVPVNEIKVSTDSEELFDHSEAIRAIDNNSSTFWHTEWKLKASTLPHYLLFDLGKVYTLDKVTYLPRQDSSFNGSILNYELYISPTLDFTTPSIIGSFTRDKLEKSIIVNSLSGRYVKLVARSEINGNNWSSAAEVKIYGFPSSLPQNISYTLTWEPVVDVTLVGYKVYRQLNCQGNFELITSVPVVTTTFTDATVISNSQYCYAIRAIDNKNNESSNSNILSIVTPRNDAMLAPKNLERKVQ